MAEPLLGSEREAGVGSEDGVAVGVAGNGDGVDNGEDGTGSEYEVLGLVTVRAEPWSEGTDGVIEAQQGLSVLMGGELGVDGARARRAGWLSVLHTGGRVALDSKQRAESRNQKWTGVDRGRPGQTGDDRKKS